MENGRFNEDDSMNAFAIVILAALIGDYALSLFADALNLSRLRSEVPGPFKDVYDPEKYRKSQEYLRANTRFSRIVSTFDLAVLLVFWFSGGFQYVDGIVRFTGMGPIATGLAFVGVLILAKGVLSLPFAIYDTFVIEERFGFNRTTVKTFVMDRIKGVLLGMALGGPLLAAILWFFNYAGTLAWVYCWIAATLYSLFIHYIAPTWIMPLFNKFSELADGDLKTAIFAYADSIRFPLNSVHVMDGSKRSRKSNAFFTGFGKNKRIVLFDTLVENHTAGELVAVLAHEMGHYKKKHILKGMLLGILETGLIFYLLSVFISSEGLFEAFFMEHISVYAGLVFFGMLFAPLEFFLGLVTLAISRKNEYEADRFAVTTTRAKGPMIAALKKLSVDNLSNLLPHPLYVFLSYSHPPILDRIAAIEGTDVGR